MADDDKLMAAVRWLIDGGDEAAARLLLMSELEMTEEYDAEAFIAGWQIVATLYGPRALHDAMEDDAWGNPLSPVKAAIERALVAVADSNGLLHLHVKAERTVALPGWREELLESLENQRDSNQGIAVREPRTWQGLRFASQSEVRIAEALDRAAVLFFPLCRGRVSKGKARVVREPDFLICHEGRWGILEVDGEPYHPPTRTVQDHDRDRLFRAQGIRHVEHYDATRCYEQADVVVAEFLALLASS